MERENRDEVGERKGKLEAKNKLESKREAERTLIASDLDGVGILQKMLAPFITELNKHIPGPGDG